MAREAGDRYRCDSCGAEIVYEKPCTCSDGDTHVETCCGQPMSRA